MDVVQPEKDILEEKSSSKNGIDFFWINLQEHERIKQQLHEAQKLREEAERLLQAE